MNGTPPEAKNEYSRAASRSRRVLPTLETGDAGRSWDRATHLPNAVLLCIVLACTLLVAAELAPLFHVQVANRAAPAQAVQTGSHDSFALIPIAALAALMGYAVYRGAGAAALIALVLLGVIALLIALVGDLPDARARGLVASRGGGYDLGSASPAAGLYLETLGAILLLIVGGLGLLRGGVGRRR